MFEGHEATVLGWLERRRLVDPDSIARILERGQALGRPVLAEAIERGWLDPTVVLSVVASELGLGWIVEPPTTLPADLVSTTEASVARAYRAVPVRRGATGLEMVVADPFLPHLAEDLTFAFGQSVRVLVSHPAAVDRLVAQHFGTVKTEPTTLVTTTEEQDSSGGPVVRIVHGLLLDTVRSRASDLHFEPYEDELRVRCRADGVLRDLRSIPVRLAPAVTSRLKVLANLDINERRVPQDGRIELKVGGRRVDLRVATLPSQHGESVVLRVLDRSSVALNLEELGLPELIREELVRVISRPTGMLIVTGPTGSGKTTTLYSALQRLHRPTRKLLSVEDPVEYEVEGVMQVATNAAAGLGFAPVLRSFLRHDPDVIMIGEIRDLETAQVAVQAALTGHLVLTTLHTNDAPGAVARLMDLGVEPFLIASTVRGVLAQRLVRKRCSNCSMTEPPCENEPVLCPRCQGSGYAGRMGLFEWLNVTETIREKILARAAVWELRATAEAAGLVTLREQGRRAIEAGLTTRAEVERHC